MRHYVRETLEARRDDAAPLLLSAYVARWLVFVFIVVFMAGTLGRAVRKPLWHDELFTLYVASGTGAEGLWSALSTGVDLNPPLYYLAVRCVAAVTGAGEVATRLPSVLGFLAAGLALYAFMRRRVDPAFAIIAALTLPLTGAFMYAWEGRPYGLALGLSAMALAAWQSRGEDGPHRLAPVICALALGAAVFTHYYAVLMVLPLAAGELTRVVVRRRIDWAMWFALALAILAPLTVLRPLIEGARQFGATFWSAPTPDKVVTFYRELLDPLSLLLVAAAGCMAFVAATWGRDSRGTRLPPASREGLRILQPEEIVVAVALVSLPVAGYLLALYTGAFHERYVLQAVLGVGILVAWASATLVTTRRNAITLVAVLFLGFLARQAGGALGLVRGRADPQADYRPLVSMVRDGSPLVVSHVLDFLPMVHYPEPNGSTRLLYLSEPPDPRLGLQTADRAIRLLARYAPLEVRDYDGFVGSQKHFYVYGRRSWLIPTLLSRGATVRFLGENENAALYAVDVAR